MKTKAFIVILSLFLLSACGDDYETRTTDYEEITVHTMISDGYVGYNTLFDDLVDSTKEQLISIKEDSENNNDLMFTYVAPDEIDQTVRHRAVFYFTEETINDTDWNSIINPITFADARWGDRTFTETYDLFDTTSSAEDETIPNAYFDILGVEFEE